MLNYSDVLPQYAGMLNESVIQKTRHSQEHIQYKLVMIQIQLLSSGATVAKNSY